MDESDLDPRGGPQSGALSRRELLRGAGISAIGAVLTDTGLAGLASATQPGSAKVLGRGPAAATPLSKNGYKVPVLEAVVRRTILAAAAA